MAVAVPMIAGFETIPQASQQEIMVPSVSPQTIHYDQPSVMYPGNWDMWGMKYSTPPGAYYGSEPNAAYVYTPRGSVYIGNLAYAEGDWSNADWPHAGGNFYGKHGAHQSRPRKYASANAGNMPARGHADKAAIGAGVRFQQPEGRDDDNLTVSVVIDNLPKVLCSDACLKVAFEHAGVDNSVKLFSVEETSAVVILKSELAAQKTMKHFRGLKGGKPSQGAVTVRYCAEAGDKLMASKEQKKDQPKANDQETIPRPQTAPAANVDTKTVQRKVEPANATSPLVLTRVALKQRWADYNFDDSDSDDYDDTQSTIAGPVPSTSDFESSSNPDELETSAILTGFETSITWQ